MADDDLMAMAARLGASADLLAALAALVRIDTEGLAVDPSVHGVLREIAAEVLDGQGIDAAQAGAVVGLASAFFRQGAELIQNPGRVGGWDQVDPVLLQGMGRLSMAIAGALRSATAELPALGARFDRPGSFLDVGTGTGWLAIAVAKAFGAQRVVGIDIFEAALDLARANVTDEGLGDRVVLRRGDVLDLAEPEFDIIWLPLPFLPAAIVAGALAAARRALLPGGWLVAGTFAPAGDDRLAELMMDLRTVRSGGAAWTAATLLPLVRGAGFTNACQAKRTWAAPVHLYIGQRE